MVTTRATIFHQVLTSCCSTLLNKKLASLDVASCCPDSVDHASGAVCVGSPVQEEGEKIGGMLQPERGLVGFASLEGWNGGTREGGGVGMAWHGMTG